MRLSRLCRERRAGVLAVRPDGMGDVLLTGPAVRAMAASGREVSFLTGPDGTAAAVLLPGVTRVMCARVPWIDPEPGRFELTQVNRLQRALRTIRPAKPSSSPRFTSRHCPWHWPCGWRECRG